MLKTEGIEVEIQSAAVKRLAQITHELNLSVRNIGARRLHAVIEKVFEDISYRCEASHITIDEKFVIERLREATESTDLRKSLM